MARQRRPQPRPLKRVLTVSARLVRLSVSGRNLLTFTPYRGYDPEVQQVARSLAAETSWELWTYPTSRTFFFSVETGF